MPRVRLRELGITVGTLPTGPYNAITDVPGVRVGHATLIADEPRVARTGVTVVVPRDGDVWNDNVFAGAFSFNGAGEMTGLAYLNEFGLIDAPIGITNTHAVGVVRDAIVADAVRRGRIDRWLVPIVGETCDAGLNDMDAFHVRQEHVFEALEAAEKSGAGPVAEGSVGGGTGMICHGFKGGIGTASRRVEVQGDGYTVGVLVQANYGARGDLRVNGIPVGREIDDAMRMPGPPEAAAGSIIVIIATDAPLLPIQCQRLARRATVGLARAGGIGHNGSGDIFLAFATGNHLPRGAASLPLTMLPHSQMDPFFVAVAEGVEEAILNALCAAEPMTGFQGRSVPALLLDELRRVMARFGG